MIHEASGLHHQGSELVKWSNVMLTILPSPMCVFAKTKVTGAVLCTNRLFDHPGFNNTSRTDELVTSGLLLKTNNALIRVYIFNFKMPPTALTERMKVVYDSTMETRRIFGRNISIHS